MASNQNEGKRKSEGKSMWLWITFILFFFGLQGLLWTNAVRLARRHPSRPVPLTLVSPNGANSESKKTSFEKN